MHTLIEHVIKEGIPILLFYINSISITCLLQHDKQCEIPSNIHLCITPVYCNEAK